MREPTLKHVLTIFSLAVVSILFLPGCLLHRHRNSDLATPVNPGDQPDKILYEKATNEINHARYDVGRLTLQTMINTYPDSEYLAKAKLAIADSYYSEGGIAGLTQSEQEYRDFITFFPTAPEAPEAQFRVGMAHFRMMAKADRDQTEARLAEAEFKEFLLKYPDNPLMPRVKARLREAQEVLAQGEYKTATFYMMRGANRAARSRLQDIVEKYPSFSRGDDALYYLGQSLERLKTPEKAVPYYSRILTDFPFSPRGDDAKARLTAMHQPIPRPTRAVLARARADAVRRHRQDLLTKMVGSMSGSPDTSATLHGPVHLGGPPPGEIEMAKTAPSAAPPANATVTAQPVGDASLNSGRPLDPKQSASSTDENAKTQKTSPDSSNANPSSDQTPPKKKGRFHILKKLIPL
jgi:outer membrane protein assembly factor BamD